MAKKIKTTYAHEICPLLFSAYITRYHDDGRTKSSNLHIACEERPRSIKRRFGHNGYIFYTAFF